MTCSHYSCISLAFCLAQPNTGSLVLQSLAETTAKEVKLQLLECGQGREAAKDKAKLQKQLAKALVDNKSLEAEVRSKWHDEP